MSHPAVLVMGATGMLGSMLVRVLTDVLGASAVAATCRSEGRLPPSAAMTVPFDATRDDPTDVLERAGSPKWVVNAIGRIKPFIDETSSSSRRLAIELNALLPHRLAEAAEERDARVLMIGTDAVFSGRAGPYTELSLPDPTDIYGATKLLGEVASERVMHLRTSIIGPEQGTRSSLMEWFLGHTERDTVSGFVNHQWNGVTSLHLARLVAGILRTGAFEPGVCHTVPADSVSKFELLTMLAHAFDRRTRVTSERAAVDIDRRLTTEDPAAGVRRWAAAGHQRVPTVREMITELASYVRASGTGSR